MRNIGLVVLTLGFLAGALVASLDEASVPWAWFVPCLIISAVGVFLMRLAAHKEASHEDRLAANVEDIDKSIQRIVENITAIDQNKMNEDVYDIPEKIDALFPDDITTFVEARESLARIYGLQAYADVMGLFAAGERYLNRVWSAAAEGYIDEVHDYLARACTQFTAVRKKIVALRAD